MAIRFFRRGHHQCVMGITSRHENEGQKFRYKSLSEVYHGPTSGVTSFKRRQQKLKGGKENVNGPGDFGHQSRMGVFESIIYIKTHENLLG